MVAMVEIGMKCWPAVVVTMAVVVGIDWVVVMVDSTMLEAGGTGEVEAAHTDGEVSKVAPLLCVLVLRSD